MSWGDKGTLVIGDSSPPRFRQTPAFPVSICPSGGGGSEARLRRLRSPSVPWIRKAARGMEQDLGRDHDM